MAWRIHESVIRGEIDNRVKGFVHGRIWLAGLDQPVELKLLGNCHPDLAGCRLQFKNPCPPTPLRQDAKMATSQEGSAGDMTASRKVRVFDLPLEESLAMIKRGEKPPEHRANSLYLEWFSTFNGRIVIESHEFELTVSAPEWRLTPAEEKARARQAAEGMEALMRQLTEAIEKHERSHPGHEEDWDEHDYEKFLKECDARTDKYLELLDKYGDAEDADAKIARAMGWDQEAAEGAGVLDSEELAELDEPTETASDLELDPAREGIDWIRTESGDVKHPLQHRCTEAAIQLWDACDELGLENSEDEDLGQLVAEYQVTGAKLAGALNAIARGSRCIDPAFTVAYLKRALNHLHKTHAALESVAIKQLLPASLIDQTRRELFQIREDILQLMQAFRNQS